MSKGIAVIFKERFGSVNQLKQQQKGIGSVATLFASAALQTQLAEKSSNIPIPEGGFQDRYVFYMITKEKYFKKPTYDGFRSSLEALKDSALEHKVPVLSMPRIGCGLDKLEWVKVKQMIIETFQETGIQINVYSP